MKPSYTKRPRHPQALVLGRGCRGGRRAMVKKYLWAAQRHIARDQPQIGVQHLNARQFRWWFRDQVYLRMQGKKFPWMAVLFDGPEREELLRAEDEHVFALLDAICPEGLGGSSIVLPQ